MITFSQLIVKTTEELVYGTLRTAARLVDIDVEALPDNEPIRSILKSVVPRAIQIACGEVIPQIAANGFLDFAEDGPPLEALGEQLYGVERIHETFATTQVMFSNAGDLAGTFAAGQVIVKNAVTGVTYRCAAFTIGAVGEVGSTNVPVDVIAMTPGTAGNAAVGQISQVVTTFDGLTVTNPNPARGQDLETREDYIARCKAAPAAASPFGPSDGYRYIATSARRPDGTAIGVTRVNVVADDPYAGVYVYLADPDGAIANDDADLIGAEIFAKVVGHGVAYGDTLSATNVSVPVTYTATALPNTGLQNSEILAMASEALARLFASWPIGGYGGVLYQSKIRSTIQELRTPDGSAQIFIDVQVSAPPSNVSLDAHEVAVLGTVSGTIGYL